MPTTTNYGWTTPADTDLVKDGAAAIRTLGSSIDTTLKTQIDAQIPDSLLTTKGDLIAATGASTPARLAIGTNDQILVADSTAATGMKWATPAGGGGMTSIATGSLSGTSTSITSIPSGYRSLRLVINDMRSTAGNFQFQFNSDGGTNYGFNTLKGGTTQYADQTAFYPDQSTPTSALNASMILDIFEYTAAFQKNFAFYGGRGDATNTFTSSFGIWNNTAALTSIQIQNGSSFTGGTYILLGVK
jgi:hypothetical protein